MLYLHVCLYRICALPTRSRRWYLIIINWSYSGEPLCRCLESNLGTATALNLEHSLLIFMIYSYQLVLVGNQEESELSILSLGSPRASLTKHL